MTTTSFRSRDGHAAGSVDDTSPDELRRVVAHAGAAAPLLASASLAVRQSWLNHLVLQRHLASVSRGPDAAGLSRGWVVGDEGKRDVAVQGGEHVQRRRVVGVEDGPQLRLARLLCVEDTLPIPGHRAQLSQQR